MTSCSFAYDHFQKTRQLACGAGKIELTVDIRCIGTSGKTARSARPKLDLLPHRNIWKEGVDPGKNVPQLKRARIPCILSLYVKGTIISVLSRLFQQCAPPPLQQWSFLSCGSLDD